MSDLEGNYFQRQCSSQDKMSGRKSERSRKSINYSKFENDENENENEDDEDDFIDHTPPIKKTKKEKSTEKETKTSRRLSAEEKYAQELELALKMSLNAAQEIPETNTEVTTSSSEISHDLVNPNNTQVVEAEVLNSPNSKLSKCSKATEEAGNRIINNGATCITDDQIESEPEQEIGTSKRKRRNTKIIKEKKDDGEDFKLSGEDKEPDCLSEIASEGSDYAETPKKSAKTNSRMSQTKENKNKATNSTTKKTAGSRKSSTPLSIKNKPVTKESRTSLKKANVSAGEISQLKKKRLSLDAANSLPPRSPSVLASRQNKFLQKGWTPPGRSGARTEAPSHPQSPSIRVGLSRFAKLTSLHPKLNSK